MVKLQSSAILVSVVVAVAVAVTAVLKHYIPVHERNTVAVYRVAVSRFAVAVAVLFKHRASGYGVPFVFYTKM